MPVFKRGTFSFNLGFVQIGGELNEEDRQCAWELYCEIVTRVAVRGSLDGESKDDFGGEVYKESLDSLYAFFLEARQIMKRFPVGKIGASDKSHLGFFIVTMLEVVVRPFLEKWHTPVRHFWKEADESIPPLERQKAFAHREALETDWAEVREFFRGTAKELAEVYRLKDMTSALPADYRQALLEEGRAVRS